jgi:hypothetical protein
VDLFAQNEPLLPERFTPRPGDFSATWYADESCRRGQCPVGFFTVVTGREGIVMTVPDAPAPSGYMVQCSSSGRGGFFLTCDDAACSRPPTFKTPFRSGSCLAATYGSRSVSFVCGSGGTVPDAEIDAAFTGVRAPAGVPAPAGNVRGASGAAAAAGAGTVAAAVVGFAAMAGAVRGEL